MCLQVGYLYGQYKRINDHVAQRGRGVLWGGTHFYPEVTPFLLLMVTNNMKDDRGVVRRHVEDIPVSAQIMVFCIHFMFMEYTVLALCSPSFTGDGVRGS